MRALRFRFAVVVVPVAFASAWACSSSSNGGGVSTGDAGDAANDTATADAGADVDNGEVSTTYPAFRPDVPQLVLADGGAINRSPKVRPVYFAGETLATPIDDTLTQWLASSAWATQMSQYGIGPASLLAPAMLTESAATTLTDTDIAMWLAGKLDGTHAEFGPVDATTLANEIFVLFYPSTTVITAFGGTSCGFGGYYSEVVVGLNTVSFIVAARCASGADEMTLTASDLITASSGNARPMSNPGYASFDRAHDTWRLRGGVDLAQPCAQTPLFMLTDGGLPISRSWSNASIVAYHDPCVPTPDATPYFVSVPVMTDDISVVGRPGPTKGITIPVGQSKTVDVLLLSDGPTSGPWSLTARVIVGQGAPGDLGFAFDRTTGQNGEKLHLTITKNAAGAKPFIVFSTLGAKKTYWIGLVN